ncbi:type 1 glutamine amidotransferase [Corynebacterium sp. 335C]
MTRTGDADLSIGLILPDVLGTYGDDGNALVLRRRAEMRGISAEVVPVRLGDAVPEGLDMYTVGGGEDVAQAIAVEHLADDGGIIRAANAGKQILAICAGFQIMGRTFRAGGRVVEGLGLVDCETDSLPVRAIGEIRTVPVTDLLEHRLTGFENHQGATHLGPDARPLGTVVRGWGNEGPELVVDADDPGRDLPGGGAEGAVQGSVVCTYLHGPCLARNPELADLLLARAMGVDPGSLQPLDLPVIDRLREERITAKPRPKSER